MIDKLEKFLLLEAGEKRCLMQALILIWKIRLALWFSSFAATKAGVEKRIAKAPLPLCPRLEIASVTRMIAVAGRFVPNSTCLVRALAGEVLLREYGYNSVLHIGVKKESASGFEAHAWLEIDGIAVLGSEVSGDFATIYRGENRV